MPADGTTPMSLRNAGTSDVNSTGFDEDAKRRLEPAGTLLLGLFHCRRLPGRLGIDGNDYCIHRNLIHFCRGIVPYGRQRGFALLVDELGTLFGENRLLDLIESLHGCGVKAFEADQVIAEARSNRLAQVADILERERRAGEGWVHLRLVEVTEMTVVTL